jgi:transcriptional regulator with XRE-family HTH domain
MFRNLAGLKQFTVAHEAGVTERTVQRIESGEKVNEDSLRRVAKALRMDENSFIGPRNVLSPEEALEQTQKQLADVMVIDAHRFATLKDCEAVLGTHGMIIGDQFVTDDAAAASASFKELLRDWNDVYGDMCSHEEELNACRSLLSGAKQLEACGYVIRYGVYTTQDSYRMVSMLFARKTDDELCAVKQMFVPSRFTELVSQR